VKERYKLFCNLSSSLCEEHTDLVGLDEDSFATCYFAKVDVNTEAGGRGQCINIKFTVFI